MASESRAQFGSSFGFLMAAAGSAVGLGNLWKFPYMAGKNGGGSFLLTYIIFVFIAGVPLLMGEFAIGRHTRLNPIGAFNALDKRFKFVGVLGVLSAFIIPFYYSIIGGWVLAYLFRFIIYISEGFPLDAEKSFSTFISNPYEPLIWGAVFLFLSLVVLYRGVERGIERFSKIMMPLLFILLAAMIIRSLTLPGAGEGVRFLLYPDWSKFNRSTVMDAMGQMFWSMSLGMGIMITYSSYMQKKNSIVKAAFTVPVLDALAAIMAGLCILPAVFAFGVDPTQGPTLTFVTLPMIFGKMPFGILFGLIFFSLLFLAAITSNLSLLEVSISYCIDNLKIKRRKAVFIVGVLTLIFSIPCSLSFGLISDQAVLGFLRFAGLEKFSLFNLNFFDFCDYISQNVFMIIAGLFTCLFIGYSWGLEKAFAEITNDGQERLPLAGFWRFMIKYASPLIMLLVLMRSLNLDRLIFGE